MNISTDAELIRFTNARGQALAGKLHIPAGLPRAIAVYTPCFTCTKDIPVAVRMAHHLVAEGIAVLRFDPTGLGDSEGNFTATDINGEIDDVRHAATWLRTQISAPLLLLGHSMGGAVSLAAAGDLSDVGAVVTLGAPANHGHLLKLLSDHAEQRFPDGSLAIHIGGKPYRFGRNLLRDLSRKNPVEAARRLTCATLFLHAPEDAIVPYAHALELFSAASEPKAFASLDGADHLLRRETDVQYCAHLIASWSARFLDILEDSQPT